MDCLKPLRAHKHPIALRLSTASKPIEPRVISKKDTVLSSGVSMGGRPERHPLKSSSRAMEAGRSIQVRIEQRVITQAKGIAGGAPRTCSLRDGHVPPRHGGPLRANRSKIASAATWSRPSFSGGLFG